MTKFEALKALQRHHAKLSLIILRGGGTKGIRKLKGNISETINLLSDYKFSDGDKGFELYVKEYDRKMRALNC